MVHGDTGAGDHRLNIKNIVILVMGVIILIGVLAIFVPKGQSTVEKAPIIYKTLPPMQLRSDICVGTYSNGVSIGFPAVNGTC